MASDFYSNQGRISKTWYWFDKYVNVWTAHRFGALGIKFRKDRKSQHPLVFSYCYVCKSRVRFMWIFNRPRIDKTVLCIPQTPFSITAQITQQLILLLSQALHKSISPIHVFLWPLVIHIRTALLCVEKSNVSMSYNSICLSCYWIVLNVANFFHVLLSVWSIKYVQLSRCPFLFLIDINGSIME